MIQISLAYNIIFDFLCYTAVHSDSDPVDKWWMAGWLSFLSPSQDSKYLFCLYVDLQQYNKAARTSIIIAREVQHAGTIWIWYKAINTKIGQSDITTLETSCRHCHLLLLIKD